MAPRRLLVGERERDLDLERERLRDDLDLLLDLMRGRLKQVRLKSVSLETTQPDTVEHFHGNTCLKDKHGFV